MEFVQTRFAGLVCVEVEPIGDERGSFARTWCRREFEEHGLHGTFVQANISRNRLKGTVRGMHWQRAPKAEAKLVRCSRGSLFDVVVDLRTDSPTYLKWLGVELSDSNGRMLFVPEGFAHGFQTLANDTEVSYLMSEFYVRELQSGARYNDPSFGIEWPIEVSTLAPKDAAWPDFSVQ